MRRLGRIIHVTPRGAVARIEAGLTVGKPLVNEKGERVGNVLDLFGPVVSPYAVVKPASGITREELASMVGKDLYEGETYEKARRKKRLPGVRKRKTRA